MPPAFHSFHSFVTARLVPRLSASWTTSHGVQHAKALATRPFLALRVDDVELSPWRAELNERQVANRRGVYTLFFISSQKPTGTHEGHYFALSSSASLSTEPTLIVNPMLENNGQPLYVHTSPHFYEDAFHELPGWDRLAVQYATAHKLDESSFRVFCRSIAERYEALPAGEGASCSLALSGGKEEAHMDWETWSGATQRERSRPSTGYTFEYLPFNGISTLKQPSILKEMDILNQLTSDFSWLGVSRTVIWAEHMRKEMKTKPHTDAHQAMTRFAYPGTLPVLVGGNLAACTLSLLSVPVPHDGQPVPPQPLGGDWDDEEPLPEFESSCSIEPSIPIADLKILVLDLFGTVLDYEAAFIDSLASLFPTHHDTNNPSKLTMRFMESQALRYQDDPSANYSEICRGALNDLATIFQVVLNKENVEDSLQLILAPRLHADAVAAIDKLRNRGYALLGLSSVDEDTFARHARPSLPAGISFNIASRTCAAMFSRSTVMQTLLERCRSITAHIEPSQILLVTSAMYRTVQPAHEAGIPTVLLQRPYALEPNAQVEGPAPTLTADSLSSLCDRLETLSTAPPSEAQPQPLATIAPFYVNGLWQASDLLGSGSFSNVFRAINVLTGEGVAIKVEMPRPGTTELSVVPYEGQIYRQVHGHPGFPSLHWTGTTGGAYVTVLDVLGPTLEQLRRFCRGKFSLKTVLMLADEMLNRVEFAHSRGLILRDIKPENFAMGKGSRCNDLFLFDLGLAKLYVNPLLGQHIPQRDGLELIGSARYASHNSHFGREQGRRDDLDALGITLLYLLHGKLPWQGIYASSYESKLVRIGEMKAGKAFDDLLGHSPSEFKAYFDHCRSLAFDDKPDYAFVQTLFRERMAQEGWEYDGAYDWVDCKYLDKGTLLPGEYVMDSV